MDIERALVLFGYLAEAWAVSRFFNRILGKEKRKEQRREREGGKGRDGSFFLFS